MQSGECHADGRDQGGCLRAWIEGLCHELEQMGFDWFAVATTDEGIELRRDGIRKPILVLGYSCEDSVSGNGGVGYNPDNIQL